MPVIPEERTTEGRVPGPAELLRRAVREGRHLPWLIDPEGIDWRWRSWIQVEDQIARSLDELRRIGAGRPYEVPVRWSPDGVAALWTALIAGEEVRPTEAVAVSGATVGGGPPGLLPVRSRLEPWTARELEPTERPGRLVHRRRDGGEEALTWVDLLERAEALAAALAARSTGGRPIVLVGGRLDGLAEQVALVTSVCLGATLAMEPDAAALCGSVVALRPRVVVAPPSWMASLPETLEPRRVRRWSRLEAVVVPAGWRAGEAWERAGLPVVEGPWSLEEVGADVSSAGPDD